MPLAGDRGDGAHLQGMVLLSLLLHGVVLALVFFAPSFPSPKLTFGPAYTVSLVSAPVSAPAGAPAPRPEASLARELMTAQRPATALKKAPEPKAIPIRPLEPRKKQEAALEKAMEDIRRRAAAKEPARPEPSRSAGEKATAPPASAPAAAAASGGGNTEVNAELQAYYALIWSRIKGKWALPQGILPGENLETVIHVAILRSGAVAELSYEKRSGHRTFDESALRAVQKASPFPPLSARIGESRLDVGIRFHSSELAR